MGAGCHGVVEFSEGGVVLLRRAEVMGAGASEGARPRAGVLSSEAHCLPLGLEQTRAPVSDRGHSSGGVVGFQACLGSLP
jgi:hypothetical protein